MSAAEQLRESSSPCSGAIAISPKLDDRTFQLEIKSPKLLSDGPTIWFCKQEGLSSILDLPSSFRSLSLSKTLFSKPHQNSSQAPPRWLRM